MYSLVMAHTPTMAMISIPKKEVVWMPSPAVAPGCPPGLEYLTQLDRVLIHQQTELMEVITNIDFEKKFQIKNKRGQQFYLAEERSDEYQRQCYTTSRGFMMHVLDNIGQEVMKMTRPFKCLAGFQCCANFDHCSHEVEIEAPIGAKIGTIKQAWSKWSPKFNILNQKNKKVLKIEGPLCIWKGFGCTQDYSFNIVTKDGQTIGAITKKCDDLSSGRTTTNYIIKFPGDLDVKLKASVLGATFLIDIMIFEVPINNRNR